MLRRVRARFQTEPLEARMLPSDEEFTTLRPVRQASVSSVARYWARLTGTASAADQAALADPETMAAPEV